MVLLGTSDIFSRRVSALKMDVIKEESGINNTENIADSWNNQEENDAVCNSDSEGEEQNKTVDNFTKSDIESSNGDTSRDDANTQGSKATTQHGAIKVEQFTNDESQLPYENDSVKQLQLVKNCAITASSNLDDAGKDKLSANDEMQNGQAVNKVSDNEDHSSSSPITEVTNEKCAGKQSLSNNKQCLGDIHIDTALVDRDVQIEGSKRNDFSQIHPSQNGNFVKPNDNNIKRTKSDPNGKLTSVLNLDGIEKKKLGESMSVPTFGSKLQRSIRERIQSLSTTNGLPVVS